MGKKRILLVDDEAKLTQMVRRNLDATGRFDVAEVNDGAAAFDAVIDFAPDLIFLDVMMPGTDGCDVTARLEADDRTGKIPIVYLTAVVSRREIPPGGGTIAGRTYLAKPVKFAELLACIDAKLGVTESGDDFLKAALDEARQGLAEGGIPIGAVIVHEGKVIGRGHNRRVQKGSAILHGEMDALENAGRLPARVYRESVLYTTLSPCPMCSGAILLYGIPRVVVGENRTFMGEEELLRSRGVTVDVVQDPGCIELMERFIAERPELWNEDIGV